MAPYGMAYHSASEGPEAIVEIERNTTASEPTTVVNSRESVGSIHG
jgi:hypothetical protein